MQIEIVFVIVVLGFIAYRLWKAREIIKEVYINGFNMMCVRFGLPPYIPKKKKDKEMKNGTKYN